MPPIPVRSEAFAAEVAHCMKVFAAGESDSAIPAVAITDPDHARKLTAFFVWTARSAVTNRGDSGPA